MEYEMKKLTTDGERVFTEDGEYLFTVSMTQEAKALLDNEGWAKGEESWIEYRTRTKSMRKAEKDKRVAFLHDLVTSYNLRCVCS